MQLSLPNELIAQNGFYLEEHRVSSGDALHLTRGRQSFNASHLTILDSVLLRKKETPIHSNEEEIINFGIIGYTRVMSKFLIGDYGR